MESERASGPGRLCRPLLRVLASIVGKRAPIQDLTSRETRFALHFERSTLALVERVICQERKEERVQAGWWPVRKLLQSSRQEGLLVWNKVRAGQVTRAISLQCQVWEEEEHPRGLGGLGPE